MCSFSKSACCSETVVWVVHLQKYHAVSWGARSDFLHGFSQDLATGSFIFELLSVLPLVYGLIQEEVEFALRSCCNRDPSILYQSSVRGESGLGARAAVSSLLSTGVVESLEGV